MIFSEYSEVWERLIFARLYLFSRIKRSPIFSGDWGVSDTCLKCYKWFQLKQSKVLLKKKNSGYLVTSLKLFSKNFPSDLQYYGEGNLNLHAAKSLQSCPTLCDPMNGSPPGSFVPGILQARTRVGCHFLLQCMKVKRESEVALLCPTLSDPMDCSPPGSSVHGIFLARVLEWGAIAFSNLHMES